MKDLKERAQALIDKYTPQLSSRGLKILLNKRYFEKTVNTTWHHSCSSTGRLLDTLILEPLERSREKRKYYYEKNKYHLFVLTLCPSEKSAGEKKEWREFAFVLKKTERAHVGLKPEKVKYREERILVKIERCIQRILKRAEKKPAAKLCRNGIGDVLRYMLHRRYGYKKSFLGKSRFAWDMIFTILIPVLLLGFVFIAWLLTK